jgi:cell division protein FtsW
MFGLGGVLLCLVTAAFFIFDHVHYRIVSLFASDGELGYQIKHSLMAFQNGGVFGKGPGEGIVRSYIPDAHTDFVFAVAGEEYGLIFCLLLVAVLAFIVLRALMVAAKEDNTFLILSLVGLICIFGFQGIVNICSTIHLGPTKGMTLPFISYGGSSTWASAMGMGRVPFFHRVRNLTGKTPAELVRDMRLKHACILLKRTNINMSELATNVGFMTAENFISIFREKFGMTPLEYRLNHRK